MPARHSYKTHHHYLTIVTDHVRQRVVWVGAGRNVAALDAFFDELGEERASKLKLVARESVTAPRGGRVEAARRPPA